MADLYEKRRRRTWRKIGRKFLNGTNTYTAAVLAFNKINDQKYKKILCSVSGGSDSDIMIDWFTAMDLDKKIVYAFFNTGLEYDATKRHLDELEKKYKIIIKRIPAIKPIPLTIKEKGVPFLTKHVSDMISRLQKHGFKWEDESVEILSQRYPKCLGAIKWWCNAYPHKQGLSKSSFNINRHKLLKEFIMTNPPNFLISADCCLYAKKKVSAMELKNGYSLNIVGVRRDENGIRSVALKNCFTQNIDKSYDDFRPLFFITDIDKQIYKFNNAVTYSDCYEVWGFKRTGCAGCPFNSKHQEELSSIEKFEPKLHLACNNIFGESYEYTRRYKEFKKT